MAFGQYALEQGGFAGSKKTGQDGHRNKSHGEFLWCQ
jgi:hypothetical protein